MLVTIIIEFNNNNNGRRLIRCVEYTGDRQRHGQSADLVVLQRDARERRMVHVRGRQQSGQELRQRLPESGGR